VIHGSPEINPPEAAPEPQLLVRARTGDREAFAALYNEHHPTVSRYVSRRLKDQHLAEDVAQEVFVRALRRIDTFEWQGANVEAWLIAIARNLVTDQYRSSWYRRVYVTDDSLDTGETMTSAEDSALRDWEINETHDVVTGALASLCSNQQRVMRLRYLEELSLAETAAVMDKTVGGIKTMAHRATRILARELRSTGAVAA
jgi:RNA polymerase sigma-70 factor (ECF subfamily)